MADEKEPMQADGRGMPPENPDQNPTAGRPDMEDNTGQSGGGAYPDAFVREHKGGFHGGQSDQAYYGDDQLGDRELGENENATSEDE